MLRQLRIQNLAIVEDVTLEFDDGLNVLTGSTGAGKSLIVGAVNLLLGRRATSTMVRAGKKGASVEAVFAAPATNDHAGGTTTVRREIKNTGRSYAYIDGATVPVRELREVCGRWIEPHGQNEQLRLRDPDTHVEYLDAFGGHGGLVERYREAHATYVAACGALERFDDRVAVLREKEELLRHRVAEVERVAVERGEMARLESQIALLENAERVHEALAFVYGGIEGDDDGVGGVTTTLAQAVRELGRVAEVDERIAAFAAQLDEAGVILRDCAQGVRSFIDAFEFDPARLAWLRERQSVLLDLERRYGVDGDELHDECDRWRRELDGISLAGEERAGLVAARDRALGALRAAADRLTQARKKAARALDADMTRRLEALMIRGARFRTAVEPEPAPNGPLRGPGGPAAALPHGGDRVRFHVRTNPGESEGPADEIASTGEVSRISLALKQSIRGRGGSKVGRSVLVFDELDAGVGADLGGVIAEKLLELSSAYQIICITHMPQIAAAARRHLVVAKRSVQGRTVARVAPVEGDARRREIARMLGGEEGSDRRAALAGEMLDGLSRHERP